MNFFKLLSKETDLVMISADYRKPDVPNPEVAMKKSIANCNAEVERIGQEIKNFSEQQIQ